MRWLFHVRPIAPTAARPDSSYAPASLEREGFVHASYLPDVLESARLYFPQGVPLEVLTIDPRRVDVPIDVASTPRGPMPHLLGPVPLDAITAITPLKSFATQAGDRVSGTHIAFVAFDGMTLLDLVGVYDPLARLRSVGIDTASACEIVAAHEGSTWAQDGATFAASSVRPPLSSFDVVVIPGGLGARRIAADAGVLAWLATYPANRLIASVCTGALILGALGRLRGRRATTHASALAELAVHGAIPVRERVVDEGQLVTAGGVTCGLDLGLHLVERLEGSLARETVARQMEWNPGR